MQNLLFPYGKEKISQTFSGELIPAKSLEEALKKAKEIVGREDASVVAIPDGVAVMVTK